MHVGKEVAMQVREEGKRKTLGRGAIQKQYSNLRYVSWHLVLNKETSTMCCIHPVTKDCQYSVSNVKVHFNVGKSIDIPEHLQSFAVHHSNFLTLRLNKFVCTIFPKNGHVNISGIQNFKQIKEAVQEINNQFGFDIREDNIVVDNSTASGHLKRRIKLFQLKRFSDKENVIISIRPHYFPSALIRSKRLSSDRRTTILFANGKFIIVGSKSPGEIDSTFKQLCALTDNLL